ncbi:MAG: type II toxin-antitoxin system RelB/DinJ family antitoxin [Desulfuromonadales bacterium]|nr:type II toxin-antitoxin system RelB/DinJ family antitoxin [Desulfuromonadales bacterium]
MKQTSISLRMDSDLKRDVENILDALGLTMTSAFTVFAKAIVRTGGIPLDLKIDPFYSRENMDEINRRIERIESGKAVLIPKTIEELRAMANE